MRVRTRFKSFFGFNRIDSVSKVDNIEMEEDMMHPEGAKINICFRGEDSSGIITLRQKEAEELLESLKPLVSLGNVKIKKFKK